MNRNHLWLLMPVVFVCLLLAPSLAVQTRATRLFDGKSFAIIDRSKGKLR